MQYELRYRGDLLGFHPSKEAAESHATKQYGYGRAKDAPRSASMVDDPENVTIEPRRPVSLFCRGNLVETFVAEDAADAFVARHIESLKASSMHPRRVIGRDAFVVVRGT